MSDDAPAPVKKSLTPLRARGGDHPKARGVITPAGRFSTATRAAEHHGITRQHAAKKARLGIDGWTYT